MPPTAPNASSMEFVPKLLCRTHVDSPDDEIVISGIAGKFPNSENVDVFEYNLFNKVSYAKFLFIHILCPNIFERHCVY